MKRQSAVSCPTYMLQHPHFSHCSDFSSRTMILNPNSADGTRSISCCLGFLREDPETLKGKQTSSMLFKQLVSHAN